MDLPAVCLQWVIVIAILILAYCAYHARKQTKHLAEEREEQKARDRSRIQRGLSMLLDELKANADLPGAALAPRPQTAQPYTELLYEVGADTEAIARVRAAYLTIQTYNYLVQALTLNPGGPSSAARKAHQDTVKKAEDAATEARKQCAQAATLMEGDPAIRDLFGVGGEV